MLYIPERHPVVERMPDGWLMTRPWITLFTQIAEILGIIITPGGIAPSDAEYLVAATDSILTAERLIQDTSTITWDFASSGIAKANAVLSDFNRRGTRAGQPVATAVDVGTLYFVTDEEVIERSNGLIWQTYSTATATAGITEISINGDIFAGAAAFLGFSGRSKLQSPSNGVLTLLNAAATDFTRLQFGGTSSSFPALKRSSAILQTKVADDTAFAQHEALDFIAQAANRFGWSGRARLTSPADSQILLTNDAASDFARLMFGGTSSSFPALKRSSAILQVRVADDTAFARVQPLGVVGTTTNDNATAGDYGEYQSSSIASGSAVSLTTATPANVTSVSLTAGDWDVWGVIDYALTAADPTRFKSGTSTTSATFGAQDTHVTQPLIATGLTDTFGHCVPMTRVSLSGTTTVYLVAQADFGAGSVAAYGSIFARRAR